MTAITHDGHEQQCPDRLRVSAGSDAVDDRDRPADVRKQVHEAPRSPAQTMAHEARCRDGDQQFDADHAEPKPQGRYEAMNGTTASSNGELREGIEHRCDDVHDQEDDDEEREVAVHGLHDELRPVRAGCVRIDVTSPTTTVALSSSSAVYPLARVAYHIGVGPRAAAITGNAGSGPARHRAGNPAVAGERRLARRYEVGRRHAGRRLTGPIHLR